MRGASSVVPMVVWLGMRLAALTDESTESIQAAWKAALKEFLMVWKLVELLEF
jgi:hypothetical protein